jgi:peroxiredoxin family protein
MGRLIDADKFKKYISESYEELKGCFKTEKGRTLACQLTKDFMLDIDEQPTAYDADKVVEELKELAIEFEFFGTCNDYVELSHAVEIVKRGGMDD